MDDRPVSVDRLQIIDTGCSERRYTAMRDHGQRRRDFERMVRRMWLRRALIGLGVEPSVLIPRDLEPIVLIEPAADLIEPVVHLLGPDGAPSVHIGGQASVMEINLREQERVSSTEEPKEQRLEELA